MATHSCLGNPMDRGAWQATKFNVPILPPCYSRVNCTLLQKGICLAEKVLMIEFLLLFIFLSLVAFKNVDWFLSIIQLSKTTCQ